MIECIKNTHNQPVFDINVLKTGFLKITEDDTSEDKYINFLLSTAISYVEKYYNIAFVTNNYTFRLNQDYLINNRLGCKVEITLLTPINYIEYVRIDNQNIEYQAYMDIGKITTDYYRMCCNSILEIRGTFGFKETIPLDLQTCIFNIVRIMYETNNECDVKCACSKDIVKGILKTYNHQIIY